MDFAFNRVPFRSTGRRGSRRSPLSAGRRPTTNLTIENLERRELMAADLGSREEPPVLLPARLGRQAAMISGPVALQGANQGTQAAPAAPRLSWTVRSSSEVLLTWSNVTNESGYRVFQFDPSSRSWRQIGSTRADETAVIVSRLAPATTHQFRVGAFNARGMSQSNSVSVTIRGSRPDAPKLSAAPVSSSAISLSWNDVSNEQGYVVSRWNGSAWVRLATLSAGATSYTARDLAANSNHWFKVDAFNSEGSSESNYVSVSTVVDIPRPRAAVAYSPAQGSLFGSDGRATYHDIAQGNIGDCWLLAGLASVAARRPDVIESMFVYRGQSVQLGYPVDVYDVKIFDSRLNARWVTVDTLLPDGGNYYSQTKGDCLWVGLVERAYAQAADYGWVQTSSSNATLSGYDKLNYGSSSWAISAVLGQTPRTSQLSNYAGEAANAWNSGVPYTLGTGSPASGYLYSTHAYAVVGYDPTATYPFTIFNPYNTVSNGWKYNSVFTAQSGFLSRQNFTDSGYAYGAQPSVVGIDAVVVTAIIVDQAGTTVGVTFAVSVGAPSEQAEEETPAVTEARATGLETASRSATFAALAEKTTPTAGGERMGIGCHIDITAWRSLGLPPSVKA